MSVPDWKAIAAKANKKALVNGLIEQSISHLRAADSMMPVQGPPTVDYSGLHWAFVVMMGVGVGTRMNWPSTEKEKADAEKALREARSSLNGHKYE